MRIKALKATLAVAAISLSGGLATSSASAAQLTSTEVTIEAQSGGDFFGYVESSDPANCAEGRKVTLFKLLGSTPDRSVDQKIGSDTASANGDGYMWSTGNTGQRKGKFYARAGKTSLCKGDVSPVVKAQK